MKKFVFALVSLGLVLTSLAASAEWQPDTNDTFELSVQKAIVTAKQKDPTLAQWFASAHAYAVYPRVGKGGIGVGGAYGKGLVIRGDSTIATTSLSQVSIGLQLGGQVYSEFVMFRDKTALDDFSRGNYELGAQASAVAITAGASADAAYNSGVAIFTIAEGGLMFEASVGGQKFKYEPK
jgi:lipid-binding SYLF domain-containing protein